MIIKHYSTNDLFNKLRNVTLLNNPKIKIYENVELTLTNSVNLLKDIFPTQRYVYLPQLLKIRDLRWKLKNQFNIDMFSLDGYLEIIDEESNEITTLLPPIIETLEVNHLPDLDEINIINDGMHRLYYSLIEWNVYPQIIVVKHIPDEYPYYAYPLINGWDDVKEVNSIPEGFIKKWHRQENYKDLYRDFNSAFKNVGGPRGRII